MAISELINEIKKYLDDDNKYKDDNEFSHYILDEYMQGEKMEMI